jgi:Leucine-rich repeat (LRR) protein
MYKIVSILLFLSITSSLAAQKKDKVYTSIEQALKEPASVKSLNLKGQSLKVLPADLIKLTNLEQLDLSYNSFTTLPVLLFKLPKLKVLDLNNNALATLPADMSGFHQLTSR